MKGISKGRRQFFEDVTKYCGAGVAALGLLRFHKAGTAHASEDRTANSKLQGVPAHGGM